MTMKIFSCQRQHLLGRKNNPRWPLREYYIIYCLLIGERCHVIEAGIVTFTRVNFHPRHWLRLARYTNSLLLPTPMPAPPPHLPLPPPNCTLILPPIPGASSATWPLPPPTPPLIYLTHVTTVTRLPSWALSQYTYVPVLHCHKSRPIFRDIPRSVDAR